MGTIKNSWSILWAFVLYSQQAVNKGGIFYSFQADEQPTACSLSLLLLSYFCDPALQMHLILHNYLILHHCFCFQFLDVINRNGNTVIIMLGENLSDLQKNLYWISLCSHSGEWLLNLIRGRFPREQISHWHLGTPVRLKKCLAPRSYF